MGNFGQYREINEVFLTQKTEMNKAREEKNVYEDLLRAQEAKAKEHEKLSEEIAKKTDIIVNLSNEVTPFFRCSIAIFVSSCQIPSKRLSP